MSTEESRLIGIVTDAANEKARRGVSKVDAIRSTDLWDIVRNEATSTPNGALREAEVIATEAALQQDQDKRVSHDISISNSRDLAALDRALVYSRRIHPRLIELMRADDDLTSSSVSFGEYETVQGTLVRALISISLHGRACLIASEVLSLLRSGLAEGAAARARALYEVLVIVYIINLDHDGANADRIHAAASLEHERYARAYAETAGQGEGADPEPAVEASLRIATAVNTLFSSERLNRSYEWARSLFPEKSERSTIYFSDLERKVGAQHLKPVHITLHWAVHVTPYSLISAGDFESETFVPVGPTTNSPETARLCGLGVHWLSMISFESLRLAAWSAERYDDLLMAADMLAWNEYYNGPVKQTGDQSE